MANGCFREKKRENREEEIKKYVTENVQVEGNYSWN